MKFMEVGKVTDIPLGALVSYTVEGKEILVVNLGGTFHAIGRRCTHAGGDLGKGTLENSVATCPRHHSKFDVTTGKRLSGPAKQDIPVYSVKTEGQNILVEV